MKRKVLSILGIFAISILLTSCELPKGPDPDTMGSATRMMMGLPPKKKDDDVNKMVSLACLMLLVGNNIRVRIRDGEN